MTWSFLFPGPVEGIVGVPSCVHLSYGEREALLCRGFGFVAAGYRVDLRSTELQSASLSLPLSRPCHYTLGRGLWSP